MTNQASRPLNLTDDPFWYKDAVIYELHVRAFYDSDGDGIGDFRGLTQRLDYLQDLGVTALWLLPFYPSPLRDDGYDIADYTRINPNYGTMRDFRAFLNEANRRGIHVITELVVNHTSDQHPWFQRARHAPPGSSHRNFYVWSDTAEKYKDTRVIFNDSENSNWGWDPVARAYYWHRFYGHQPDLNYRSKAVQQSIKRVMDFYLGLGVSGLRLDAIPYLYEREGTNCENLRETHEFLKELRAHVDQKFQNRMLLGEANQWPEDAVAYFGNGDECHMAFHFPVMPRMFMAIRMEDRHPIVDILQQTPGIPESCQWAMFLRNHDELTLEMVTDEERDYMYRLFAHERKMRINMGIRRRLAPLLNNDRNKMELMNSLLFALPGTPVLYYGDEIGMGDNIYLGDRNGVRTPMQWSSDRNAGFSSANSQALYLPVVIDPEYHHEAVNVKNQQNNHDSLLWWMKRIIALRKRHQAFSRGTLEFLSPENNKVLAFLRSYQGETILVVANLSRRVQHTSLDLPQYAGLVPVELFGQSNFPPVGEDPYFLTLGPYSFYWFSLEQSRIDLNSPPDALANMIVPVLAVRGEWHNLFSRETRPVLSSVLTGYIRGRRWFGGKARHILNLDIGDVIQMENDNCDVRFLLLVVEYTEGEPETYVLPLAFAAGGLAQQIAEESPYAVVAQLEPGGPGSDPAGILYDALVNPKFNRLLLESIAHRRNFRGEAGQISAVPSRVFRRLAGPDWAEIAPVPLREDQTNTSISFGDRMILKLFRRLGEGMNPDLGMGRFLTEVASFPHIPALAGALEYRRTRNEEPMTVGIMHSFVTNQGSAWRYTLDSLGDFLERALTNAGNPIVPDQPLLKLIQAEAPALAQETIGPYLESARLLGHRTAELHLALASSSTDPAFTPEHFSGLYRRSLYQSMRNSTNQNFDLLRQRLPGLREDARASARKVLERRGEILDNFRQLTAQPLEASRIRCHGDYHLGQVLYTGGNFIIIDFEGEPARPITERRLKRCPLRDVAAMLRSFHYATSAAISGEAHIVIRPEDSAVLEGWARFWYSWVSAAFLTAYLETADASNFFPEDPVQLQALLDIYLLEKAVYEVGYELNNRPDWVKVPLQGILQLLGDPA
jgi:maltose alpha-D-glucosyltransferase/alpha-amylase